MANGWGGPRANSGRKSVLEEYPLNSFRKRCRSESEEIVTRLMSIVREGEADQSIKAGVVILEYAFGKPRETISFEGDVTNGKEMLTLDQIRGQLMEAGLPIGHLQPMRLIESDKDDAA